MPKTDTTGGHHSFENLMRKYCEGIANMVYAAEEVCAICNLDAIRTAIGPQKIRTDVH